jgi:Stage II sporulation protein E (SpoIIE)
MGARYAPAQSGSARALLRTLVAPLAKECPGASCQHGRRPDNRTDGSSSVIKQPAASPTPAAGAARLTELATQIDPGSVQDLIDAVCSIVGASSGRLSVADYGLQRLQQLGVHGPVGDSQPIDGTIAGRAFATGEIIDSADRQGLLWVPLTDRNERLGVLELDFATGDIDRDMLDPVIAVLVLLLISARRYSDVWSQSRRAEAMSAAAEAQWSLLPPLACTTGRVAVGGILEPAYEIGGDSFDYALNGDRLDFAIVDAIGHGMSAVLMSGVAINSLRNDRRAGRDLTSAYRHADQMMIDHFGDSYYVTGQIGTLDLTTGVMTWLNAGHVPPMLVRNGTFAGELHCQPSMPLGLGGPVKAVAAHALQRGDRVLFYTDGITESKAPDGTYFGTERLADFLVRASLDQTPAAETVRRLAAAVVSYVGRGLNDDATMLLIEYRGNTEQPD